MEINEIIKVLEKELNSKLPIYKAKRVDVDWDEWVIGYVSRLHATKENDKPNFMYQFNAITEDMCTKECYVSVETLCRYTGKADKNGNFIWENDIIGFLDVSAYDNGYSEHYCRGHVVWDEDTLSFEVTERISCESYEALDGDCEVIGDIFNNPELLK